MPVDADTLDAIRFDYLTRLMAVPASNRNISPIKHSILRTVLFRSDGDTSKTPIRISLASLSERIGRDGKRARRKRAWYGDYEAANNGVIDFEDMNRGVQPAFASLVANKRLTVIGDVGESNVVEVTSVVEGASVVEETVVEDGEATTKTRPTGGAKGEPYRVCIAPLTVTARKPQWRLAYPAVKCLSLQVSPIGPTLERSYCYVVWSVGRAGTRIETLSGWSEILGTSRNTALRHLQGLAGGGVGIALVEHEPELREGAGRRAKLYEVIATLPGPGKAPDGAQRHRLYRMRERKALEPLVRPEKMKPAVTTAPTPAPAAPASASASAPSVEWVAPSGVTASSPIADDVIIEDEDIPWEDILG